MPPAIAAIETTGRSPRARRLLFDHAEPVTTSAPVVKVLGLEAGDVVDPDELSSRIVEVEPELAKERALRMLGYRERSVRELRHGLLDDGYSRATVDAVVDRLSDLGLVDDERFARLWAAGRTRAGYGRRRILRELADKGIDPSIAEQALDDAAPPGDSVERARAVLRGRTASDRAGRDRLVRKLVSRGFDLQTALAAVDSAADDEQAL